MTEQLVLAPEQTPQNPSLESLQGLLTPVDQSHFTRILRLDTLPTNPVAAELIDTYIEHAHAEVQAIPEGEAYGGLAGPLEWGYQPQDAKQVAAGKMLMQLPTVSRVAQRLAGQTEALDGDTAQRFGQADFSRLDTALRQTFFAFNNVGGRSSFAYQTGASIADRLADVKATGILHPELAEDAERAERDTIFLLSLTNHALRGRNWGTASQTVDSLALNLDRHVYDKNAHSDEWYFSSRVSTASPEGDHKQDDLLSEQAGYEHPGTFRMFVSSNRITLSYKPGLDHAREHYDVQVSKGDRSWRYEDVRLSLELDDATPSGLSLDMGRDERSGAGGGIRRNADLLGKLLTKATPGQTTHHDSRYTHDMHKQFAAFGERVTQRMQRWETPRTLGKVAQMSEQ